jgi:hypothetical protein
MGNKFIKRANATAEYTPEALADFTRCAKDPIYFMTNYVWISDPKKGPTLFKLFDYQIEMVQHIHENKDTVILASRQLGKTTVVAMYMLWFALFHKRKKCIIASKGMGHATEIMSRIKYAYEELPNWLKCGCKFYNRTSIQFDNGSEIKCEATSINTGRGDSPSILFIDELAFIPRRIQDEMWASITPALSNGGKFIMTSTPNGDNELYSTIWRGANSQQNSFKPLRVMWYQHPDRGQEYYNEMKGKLGELKTRQELDCEFLSSDALLINSIVLAQLRSQVHVETNLGFKFFQPMDSLPGRDKTYLVGLDPATGHGGDCSVIEVFAFPSMEQVAEFRSNEINIPLLYAKLKWLLNFLSQNRNGGEAEVHWTFERNGIGEALSALYFNDETQPEHPQLLSEGMDKFGVYTTGKQKILSCLKLKQLVEKSENGLKLNSQDLLEELKNFVSKGGGYAAKPGGTDDCVMAVVLVVRLLERLAYSNEEAFKRVNEYVSVDDQAQLPMDDSDEPMPFSF